MKKKYIAPDIELVLFEAAENMMADGGDIDDSSTDPWAGLRMRNFHAMLQDLPDGTFLDPDGYPQN